MIENLGAKVAAVGATAGVILAGTAETASAHTADVEVLSDCVTDGPEVRVNLNDFEGHDLIGNAVTISFLDKADDSLAIIDVVPESDLFEDGGESVEYDVEAGEFEVEISWQIDADGDNVYTEGIDTAFSRKRDVIVDPYCATTTTSSTTTTAPTTTVAPTTTTTPTTTSSSTTSSTTSTTTTSTTSTTTTTTTMPTTTSSTEAPQLEMPEFAHDVDCGGVIYSDFNKLGSKILFVTSQLSQGDGEASSTRSDWTRRTEAADFKDGKVAHEIPVGVGGYNLEQRAAEDTNGSGAFDTGDRVYELSTEDLTVEACDSTSTSTTPNSTTTTITKTTGSTLPATGNGETTRTAANIALGLLAAGVALVIAAARRPAPAFARVRSNFKGRR